MIEATRPEPTVLPPSRIFVAETVIFSCDFRCIFGVFLFYMRMVFYVF